MAVVGELLFFRRNQVDLAAVLRDKGGDGVRNLVDGLSESTFSKHTDDELTAQVVAKARIAPLNVDFAAAQANVQEATVDVNTGFGERVRVRGLRATKAIPFTGDADLWHLRPNQYDLNPPYGEVSGKQIVVGTEVEKQQGEQAAAHIEDTIAKIKEWLKHQEAQLSTFNASLPAVVATQIQQRRARLNKAVDLLKKLQG